MRRCGLATASAALVPLGALLLALLWALAVAPVAVAGEPEDRQAGGSGWEGRGGPAAWERPGRLLRYSRESFQRAMNRLAERSARLHPPFAPDPAPPGPDRPKRDWPSATPGGQERGGQERGRPEPDSREPDSRESDSRELDSRESDSREPDWPWPTEPTTERMERRRYTVEVDRDRPRRRVRDWHKGWSHSCRRAGRVVEGAGWYVVAPGDTLQRIAELHYGDEGAWRRILQVNGGTISDPDLIYACQRLLIPRRHTDWPQCEEPPIKPPHRVCHRSWCDDPVPVRPVCDRPPPPPVHPPAHRGPGGCSRCGAGAHDGSSGWR